MKRRVIGKIKFSDYDTQADLITSAHNAAVARADHVFMLTGVREPSGICKRPCVGCMTKSAVTITTLQSTHRTRVSASAHVAEES